MQNTLKARQNTITKEVDRNTCHIYLFTFISLLLVIIQRHTAALYIWHVNTSNANNVLHTGRPSQMFSDQEFALTNCPPCKASLKRWYYHQLVSKRRTMGSPAWNNNPMGYKDLLIEPPDHPDIQAWSVSLTSQLPMRNLQWATW
jgi:hypothetical protein